jgi:hypothetical protein
MVIEDIGEVIAERTLMKPVRGGEPGIVVVRLGKPRPFPDASGFYSPFEVVGLGDHKIRYAAGVDAFQSLQLAFRMISSLLHQYSREPSVEMFFLEPGDNLGFPE